MSRGTSNLIVDLDIENTLQCPVCYEISPDVIYMCTIGHHVCGGCSSRLTKCPTCNSLITGTRNFLGEALNKLSIELKGSGDAGANGNLDDALGSIAATSMQNNLLTFFRTTRHLSNNNNLLVRLPNPSGLYKCLLESCNNRSEMGVANMFAHVMKVHGHLFDRFQNSTGTFEHKFENFCFIKRGRKYHRAFNVTNMALFFLQLEIDGENYIRCWLSTPAGLAVCNSFHCELKFSKGNCKHSMQFCSKVASNLQKRSQILETGKVFVISPEDHVMNDGDFFSFNVKIVYRPTDTAQSLN